MNDKDLRNYIISTVTKDLKLKFRLEKINSSFDSILGLDGDAVLNGISKRSKVMLSKK